MRQGDFHELNTRRTHLHFYMFSFLLLVKVIKYLSIRIFFAARLVCKMSVCLLYLVFLVAVKASNLMCLIWRHSTYPDLQRMTSFRM